MSSIMARPSSTRSSNRNLRSASPRAGELVTTTTRRRDGAGMTEATSSFHHLVRDLVHDGDVQASKAEHSSHISALLLEVADYLASLRPADRMTNAARWTIACHFAGTDKGRRPLLRLLPPTAGGTSRGEYAAKLRELAAPAAAGHTP